MNNNIENIHICMACNETYAPHCAAAIASVIHNSGKTSFLNFYVLNSNLTEKTKKKLSQLANNKNSNIVFKQMQYSDFADCPIPQNTHFSIETYFRLKIASIFPSLDKILYIDCDTITKGDIKELWDTDITNYYAAACPNIANLKHLHKFVGENCYFNAGILLINCKKWREDNLEQKYFNFVENHSENILWVDQDVLNSVLAGNVKYFETHWNLQYNPHYDKYTKYTNVYKDEEIKLIHYTTANKPWATDIKIKYAKDYYKYAFKTPWKLLALRNYISNNVLILLQPLNLKTYICDQKIVNKLKKETENNRVVLWGASVYLKKLIKYHNLNSSNIVGIIDKDTEKTGKKMGKYTIYHPNALSTLKPTKIISSVVNHPDMQKFIEKELQHQHLKIDVDVKLFTTK